MCSHREAREAEGKNGGNAQYLIIKSGGGVVYVIKTVQKQTRRNLFN